jgi:diguanylate cyclase (GGDEF)-like protein
MTLIENKFSIYYSLLISYDNEKAQVMYSSDKRRISKQKLDKLDTIICNYNAPFVSVENIELNSYVESITNEKVKSLIYIPVIKNNKLKVAFLCVTKVDNDVVNNKVVLNSSNLRIINIAIRQLSETIQKIHWQEKLIASISTDMLTGLYNRQYFYNKISSLLKQCNKKTELREKNICLFYIDLDNFKYYNDTFGHTVGDSVLIWFGEILRNVSTKKSSAIRYGGDEFLLFLEDCNEEQFIKIANKIYENIKESDGFKERIIQMLETKIDIPKNNLLSCSIGISYTKLNEEISVSEFINNADKCLYEAKRSGKSKYVISKGNEPK